jgi:asparagine synthase (glutamine-hydrolysing)
VWDDKEMRKRIYGPRMLTADLENPFEFLRGTWPEHDDPVIAAATFEIEQKMVNDLLLQEDRLSMAFGLEVRVPFLDEDLAKFTLCLRRQEKMPGGRLKKMMRDAVSEWLPKKVLARPKSGFQVPIKAFFHNELKPLCDKYLSEKRLKDDGLFNSDFVAQVIAARPRKSLRWHYFILYLMIGVNVWQDVFLEGQRVEKWH